ncbi:MAG: hypothetical protein OEW15_11575 [Nitrospirota bacterium]|nr:hypothetical protein [Nitrospirota bacterium]
MAKKKAPAKKNNEATLVPIKIHERAIREIKANAKKYAAGNFSAWMRHASIHYKPKRGEVVDLSTMPSGKARAKKKR